ncbi:MAG: hypothetical protein QNJ54_12495 [Prochloraceae cyanobacterium]|nr:hypothetical protein [Prochloraceae cyanobacterium]
MKKYILSIVIGALVAVAAKQLIIPPLADNIFNSQTSSIQWQKYLSSEGDFSVLLPGEPEQIKKSIATENERIIPTTIISVNLKKAEQVYLVAYSDYPFNLFGKDRDSEKIQKFLAERIKDYDRQFQGKIEEQQPKQVNATACIKFKSHGKKQEHLIHIKGLTCVKQNRLYQVITLTKQNNSSDINQEKFLNSFSFNK